MTEGQLLGHILAAAAELGLLVFHPLTLCARCLKPVGGYMAGQRGFPDLVVAGPRGTLFRELKDAWAMPRPSQTKWRYTLLAGGADYAVWRPAAWFDGTIRRELLAIR